MTKNKSKILLVCLNKLEDLAPLQLGYLKVYSENFSFIRENYQIIIYSESLDNFIEEEFIKLLAKEKFFAIGFSLYIWNVTIVRPLIKRIKKIFPRIKIILGGPECTPNLNFDSIDFVVIGEGEEAFRQILNSKFSKKALIEKKGIAFHHNKSFFYKQTSQHLDLNSIPSPFLNNVFDLAKYRNIFLESIRGCPFRCAYCAKSNFLSGPVRYFSISRVKKELLYIMLHAPNLKILFLIDDNFNLNTERMTQLCKFLNLIRKFKIFVLDIAICYKSFNRLQCKLLKLAKANIVGIGLQTMNPDATEHLSRWKFDREEFFQKIALFENTNIKINIYLIIGLPGDNFQGFKKSLDDLVEFLSQRKRIKAKIICLRLVVLPNTLFWRNAEQFKIKFYRNSPYHEYSNYSFSRKDMKKAMAYTRSVRKNPAVPELCLVSG